MQAVRDPAHALGRLLQPQDVHISLPILQAVLFKYFGF